MGSTVALSLTPQKEKGNFDLVTRMHSLCAGLDWENPAKAL